MELLEYVASRIRKLRESHDGGRGLSQQELAKKLEIAANTVSRWETGTYKPSLADLDKLARFFGVPITTFFSEAPDAENDTLRALLRTAKELTPDDQKELQRYAEFRHAREQHGRLGRPRRRKTTGDGE